ncbi:hypothetical protein [Clostridium neonatale]|uniref:hypothetical protein n=1 Tax=Clostridium neonatale TaxID=137838 RepID=UPI00291C3EDE|nr:putative Carbon monoxide dehydrogenase [Clostridium neonatale]
MGIMNREHKCYVCCENFEYNYSTPFRGVETQSERGVKGKAVAIGVIRGTEGTITKYEVTVKCPECNMINKIKL